MPKLASVWLGFRKTLTREVLFGLRSGVWIQPRNSHGKILSQQRSKANSRPVSPNHETGNSLPTSQPFWGLCSNISSTSVRVPFHKQTVLCQGLSNFGSRSTLLFRAALHPSLQEFHKISRCGKRKSAAKGENPGFCDEFTAHILCFLASASGYSYLREKHFKTSRHRRWRSAGSLEQETLYNPLWTGVSRSLIFQAFYCDTVAGCWASS
jgi:hypothetical protein